MLHAIDVVKALASGQGDVSAAAIARETLTVPETMAADDLLASLRQRGVREAVVIDEYGGTAGLVTFEWLMERIVGAAGTGKTTMHQDGSADIDGLTLVTDVNEQFGLHIDERHLHDARRVRDGPHRTPGARRRHDRSRRTSHAGDRARRTASREGVGVDAGAVQRRTAGALTESAVTRA